MDKVSRRTIGASKPEHGRIDEKESQDSAMLRLRCVREFERPDLVLEDVGPGGYPSFLYGVDQTDKLDSRHPVCTPKDVFQPFVVVIGMIHILASSWSDC